MDFCPAHGRQTVSPKMSNSLNNPHYTKIVWHVNPPDLLDTFAIFDWVCQCQIHFGCPLPNLLSVWSNFTNYENVLVVRAPFSRLNLFIPAVAFPDPPHFHFNIAATKATGENAFKIFKKLESHRGRIIPPGFFGWLIHWKLTGVDLDMPSLEQQTDKKCFWRQPPNGSRQLIKTAHASSFLKRFGQIGIFRTNIGIHV